MALLHLLGNEIHVATFRGDINALEILARHQSLECPGRYFLSSIHVAAGIGCWETVAWIIKNGVQLDHARGNPLHVAVEGGHREVVKILLDAGADPNVSKGEYGSTLQSAVFLDKLDMVELLIARNADFTRERSVFGSALDIAACRRDDNAAMIVTLVRAGAKVDLRDSGHIPAIEGAVICGHWKNVRTLMQLGASRGRSLELAISRKQLRITSMMLEHQPRLLESVTTSQWSPLTCAVKNGDISMVILILRMVQAAFRPTLLEMTDAWPRWTAYDYARRSGHQRIIRLLEMTKAHQSEPHLIYRSK